MTLPDLSSAQIGLTIALVVITGIYAWRTFAISKATKKQAEASAKMAEEMKEQRLAMYKPNIILEYESGKRGKYFMKEIYIATRYVQGGPAINVDLYITHPLFKFTKHHDCFHISVGGAIYVGRRYSVEEPSVEDDPGVPIDSLAVVVANYEDVFGNPWHSTLELHWDAVSKDVTPGHMNVAVPGHHKEGSNDS